jgi:ethanolamine utilization cobalamin adenosyltransferase
MTTLDSVLLKDNNRALVAKSGPEINFRACLCVLLMCVMCLEAFMATEFSKNLGVTSEFDGLDTL